MREIIVDGINELNSKGMIKENNGNSVVLDNDKDFNSDLKVEGFEELEEIKHEPVPVHKGVDLPKETKTIEKIETPVKIEPITRVVERPRPIKTSISVVPPVKEEQPVAVAPMPEKIKNFNPSDDDKYYDDLCKLITDKVTEQSTKLKEQQERLKLYDSEVERLQQIIKANYTTVEEMKTDIKNKDEHISKLETENARLNEIIDSIQKSISPMLNTLGIKNELNS